MMCIITKKGKAIPFVTGLDRTLGPQEFEGPRIYRQPAYEGGKFVSPTHWPPLPSEDIPGTFRLVTKTTLGS
jgi:hypothetical protein